MTNLVRILVFFVFAAAALSTQALVLVKTKSNFIDLYSKKTIEIRGVGTIFKTSSFESNRYFILTPSHVIGGADISAELASGFRLPIVRKYHHPTLDLAILEVAPFVGSRLSLQAELRADEVEQGICISLGKSLGLNSSRFKQVGMVGQFNSILSAESFDMISFHSQEYNKTDAILVPGDTALDTIGALSGWSPMTAKLKQAQTSIDAEIPPGFSGTPLVTQDANRGRGGICNGSIVLNGMLVLSENGVTYALPIPYLNNFLDQILEGRVESGQSYKNWQIIDNKFASFGEDEIIFYSKQKPIGNGVIIEGYKKFDAEKIAEERLSFKQQMFVKSLTDSPKTKLDSGKKLEILRAAQKADLKLTEK